MTEARNILPPSATDTPITTLILVCEVEGCAETKAEAVAAVLFVATFSDIVGDEVGGL